MYRTHKTFRLRSFAQKAETAAENKCTLLTLLSISINYTVHTRIPHRTVAPFSHINLNPAGAGEADAVLTRAS